MYKILLKSVFLIILFSCEAYDYEEINFSDCQKNLLTTDILVDQPGIIKYSEADQKYYIEFSNDSSTIFVCPCNLPEKFFVDGKEVLFTGKLKEKDSLNQYQVEIIKIKFQPAH